MSRLADQLDRGEPVTVAGQLAAFAIDVPTDPDALETTADRPVQSALFDPEVDQ